VDKLTSQIAPHVASPASQASSSVQQAATWVASALGLGALAGWVNLFVALLSGAWVATQLWREWRYNIPALRRAKAQALAESRPISEVSIQPTTRRWLRR